MTSGNKIGLSPSRNATFSELVAAAAAAPSPTAEGTVATVVVAPTAEVAPPPADAVVKKGKKLSTPRKEDLPPAPTPAAILAGVPEEWKTRTEEISGPHKDHLIVTNGLSIERSNLAASSNSRARAG